MPVNLSQQLLRTNNEIESFVGGRKRASMNQFYENKYVGLVERIR